MASSLDVAASRPSSGVVSPPQRMPSRSRTQSISSDRPSTVAHSLMSPPLSVSPEPAFIAASAASQIVTNDHDSHAETWYDQHGIEPSGETAVVSPGALHLVNNFLDQLLFNFIAVSRATTLAALRPAVSEVLKPKLAKDAVNQADEELREYLGGDEEDGAQAQARDASPSDWDLELAWKRTRLRCMVYSSLGDMEEEDEDFYMEQGHLETGLEDRFSETVSPAVAIFLTSILEFMGEQALVVAGQAAYHRMRLKYEKELKDGSRSPTGIADKIVVEDSDMERVALDRTLGRLWRSWKKKIRSPAIGSIDRLARSYSRDSLLSASGHMRSPSSAAELAVPATVPEPDAETEQARTDTGDQEDAQEPVEEYLVAADIPLPMRPNDVAEIEVPWLAPDIDDEAEKDGAEAQGKPARPKSLVILPWSETFDPLGITSSRPQAMRKRSNSLPSATHARDVIRADSHPSQPSAVLSKDSPSESPEPPVGATSDAVGTSQDALEDIQATGISSTESRVVSGENVAKEDEMKDEDDDDDDDDDEVSIEEPRIVRSSRVSIFGRSPSTTSSEFGRPPSINTNLPIRTPSIHSARLIEVTTPRSPVVGSRRNSLVIGESVRHTSPARTSRTITPPVPDDRTEQPGAGSSSGRLTVTPGIKSGLAASESISETEEPADKEYTVSPLTPINPAAYADGLPTIPEPVTKEDYEASVAAAQSSMRRPSTPPRASSKVTILPATSSPVSIASTASSVFYIESMPVLPEEDAEQFQADGRPSRSAARNLPAVPERSSGRQAVANTSALRQPAAIGQVSVERSRTRSPSQGERSAGRARQQPPSGSPSSTKLKAVRTSEEGMQSRIDVVRDFEELIQSDQTIQYTLTPESMRDLDHQSQLARSIGTGSPVVSIKPRKSEEARRTGSRSRSSSVPRTDAKTPPAMPAPRSPGSGSHSTTDTYQASRNISAGTGKHGGVVPRSIPPMPSKSRPNNGPQARDARLGRESLAEFADFIRSTGPAGGSVTPAAEASPARVRNQGSVSNISMTSSASNPNRPKYQARGATVDYKDDNSDLIDFIRRGPPSAGGNPRIPRAVAPFRTTMDSDQLSGAVGGRAVDAQLRDDELRSSQASNTTDYSVPPSVQSSVNSHSALLARNKPMSYDTVDDDMPMPKRKTRRVRDPYAIDFSDEEDLEDDDELTPMPKKKPQTQGESLIDFLNSYAPPPEPTVLPLNTAQARSALQKPPKKKASAPSLMARLTRPYSARPFPGQHQPQQQAKRPTSPKVVAESRSLNSRASGGGGGGGKGSHVPIQVNIPGGGGGAGMDGRAPVHAQHPSRTSSKAAAMMGGGPGSGPVGGMGGGSGSGSGSGRVPMKRFEPREAVSVPNRATSDLAEFFKHSGPPPGSMPMVNQFPGPVERDEGNGGGVTKMFSRRKKSSLF